MTHNILIARQEIIGARGSELVTVANVPMVSTGIDYPTSTGLITLTEAHLSDLVASQDDPAIHAPRTKIGHTDPRFNGTITPDGDALDGEPSLGTWLNLRLGNNNQTVYGDLVGVPKWFADIMSTAYPSRSIEGNFDVETVTGKKWSLAIEACVLLGVVGPGITTLDDLPILFSAEGPDNVKVIESKEGDPMSVRAGAKVTAQANLDDVRRQYYEALEPSQMWWWIRSIYLEPDELIVDDDEGGLYRVPFDASGDEVTFSDPQQVVIQYVDKPKTAASASLRASLAQALGGDRIAATYTVRAVSRSTGGSMTQEQIEALRSRLNLTPEQLPDNADDATILQVLSTETAPTPPPSNEPAPEETPAQPVQTPPATPGQPVSPPPPQTPPEAPKIPEGYSVIDDATLQHLREGAEAGLTLASRDRASERDRAIDAAIQAGKIMPSRRDQYVLMWSGKDGKGGDPEGTKALLDALAPGLVPVEARGTAAPGGGSLESQSEYDSSWLSPSERRRIEVSAKQDGQATRVTHGGD